MTTIGAGLSVGRNCAPSSAPNTGAEKDKTIEKLASGNRTQTAN